jgi:Flp pilus assembly protein TadB
MTAAVMIGAGFGLGLWSLVVWLAPPRPALRAVLARSAAMTSPSAVSSGGRGRRVVRPVITAMRAVGLPTPRQVRDLVLVGRGVDDHLAEKVALAVAGAVIPALGAAAAHILGIDIGLQVPLVLAFICAAGGFLLPDIRVRQAARQRRADFRHALSAYIDLVVISLAGGAGVDSALNDSVAIGNGWAFKQLRSALAAARFTRDTPWTALYRLGDELAVPELSEIAASLSLAGTEGAKVRRSLIAKASSLRTRQLADAESRAASNTERMSLPIVLLFLGFLIFIAYPAAQRILTGL